MRSQSLSGNLFRGIKDRLLSPFGKEASGGVGWFLEKWLKHVPAGKQRTVRLGGTSFTFLNPSEFLHTYREIYGNGIYELRLRDSPFIIDCGANIGIGTIYLKQRHPGAAILAFEPDETNFALLERNIRDAGFKDIELRKEAVWKEDGTIDFSPDSNMGSRIEESGSGTRKVKAVRLRNVIDREVDFLKLDIEGAEYAVLPAVGEIVARFRPRLVFELHAAPEAQKAALTDVLLGYGYRVQKVKQSENEGAPLMLAVPD